MGRRYNRDKSDSQANADALARRDAPYSAASGVSFAVRWDWHRREPADLRDAVRMVRKAYADEVPSKLHEGPDSIGEGGTPKMTARAEGYIFGRAQGTDRTDPSEAVSYYHSPFRATLDTMEKASESERHRAAIVRHVAIGGQWPAESAMVEGIPRWAAKDVAELALRAFLRAMTDLKLHPRTADPTGEAVAVA